MDHLLAIGFLGHNIGKGTATIDPKMPLGLGGRDGEI
jgi:hypothetical protein